MNALIPATPMLLRALSQIWACLTVEQRINIEQRKAKLIVIDGEVWYIDMCMSAGVKHERK